MDNVTQRLLTNKLQRALADLRACHATLHKQREWTKHVQSAGLDDGPDSVSRAGKFRGLLDQANEAVDAAFFKAHAALADLGDADSIVCEYGVPDLSRTVVLWLDEPTHQAFREACDLLARDKGAACEAPDGVTYDGTPESALAIVLHLFLDLSRQAAETAARPTGESDRQRAACG